MGLTIDSLSVEGVGESSARRLGAALERRLGALIAERGLPDGLQRPQGVDIESVDLPGFELDLKRGPERAGSRLAEALWTRLQRPLDREADARRRPARPLEPDR